jgi:CHASE3 domain sensor protein
VLGRLVDARLLTTGRDDAGQEVVDVSHEALIRGWPRLRSWIDADRAGLLIHRRMTDAAQQWENLNREPGSLYRGARLAAGREWATEHADDLSPLERDFLTASHANEHADAEATRRRTRRLRGLASGLGMLGIALIVLIVTVTAQRAAQRDAASTAFRSQQALTLANQLEKSMLSIESGLNRYVTTEQESFLVPVRRELAANPAATRRLADLVSDDPGQQRRARAIGDAIKDYDDLWASLLPDVARQDFATARAQVRTSGGRDRLDAIRKQFASLFDRERAIIRGRERSAEQHLARAMDWGVGGLSLVLVVTLGLMIYLLRDQSRGRKKSQTTGRPSSIAG